MSKLSKPASLFLQKILTHYPLSPQSECEQPQHTSKPPIQHLHDYRKEREIYDKSTKQKLQSMQTFKDEGNGHYQHGRYGEASYFYQKAIVYGDYTFPERKEEEELMNGLLQKSHCNLGLSLIKMGKWSQAKNHLSQASRGADPKIKEKAQYWLAKYYIRGGQTEEARSLISQIGKDNPSLSSLQELSLEVKLMEERQAKEEKKMFSKII